MKKLLLGCLVALGGTLRAMAPTPHLLSRNVLALLEAQEYTRGANTTLIQIPVLDQLKEDTARGSSNHSCVYHALRNGSCAIQAMLDPHTSTTHLATLYDKAHMYHKLALDGDWRTFIRSKRPGAFTDNLTIEELENLLDREKDHTNAHASLANKGVEVAYFEYASPDEPSKDNFEGFCVGTGLKEIKRRINAGEDFASLIVVYVDTHNEEPGIECTTCKNEETNQQTPCCHNVSLCQKCWTNALEKDEECPLCKKEKPGNDLIGVPVKPDAPRNGHYVALVLAQAGRKRQYVLMDSDTSASQRFW